MIVPRTEITVSKDGVEIKRMTVPPGEYVIGREPGCDLPLEVELVSRRHARLTVNSDHALIEDLGSSNGTQVNGKPVSRSVRLWPNQKIEIGLATIEVRRIKDASSIDLSLAPDAAVLREVLPEEFLRDKKYEIGGVVAQGGMGAILDAKEATTGRTVAMKVMLQSGSAENVMRFVAEAKVTARLEHPNIVPVHELSVDENDQVFYTMKFVRGETLREVLEKLRDGDKATLAKYPLATLLTAFQKVCDALAFAHSKGVIHRDLKPANLMLGDYGEVLVMDWGLAKMGAEDWSTDDGQPSDLSPLVTMEGRVMGTPQYMSPEQARGDTTEIDARTDIYALGAILYNILALRPPVGGKSAFEVLEKVGRGAIAPLNEAVADLACRTRHLLGGQVPESLDAVVRKAMALDPDARYRNVEALQADITAYQNGFATKAEKAGLGKHFLLFVKRHKAVSIAVVASLFLLVGITTAFTLRVLHERNLAVAERNNALKSQAEAEGERNRAQQSQTAAEKAQADAESQRSRTEKALADAETERNRAQKALADFEAERTRADTEHSTAETQRTRAEGESGRAEKALADLKQTAPALYSLAKSRFAEEKFNEALDQIGFALKNDDVNPDYHLLYAEALQSIKKYPEAVMEYRRVLELRPDDKTANSYMVICKLLSQDQSLDVIGTTLGLVACWKAERGGKDPIGSSNCKVLNSVRRMRNAGGINEEAFIIDGKSVFLVKHSPAWELGKNDFTIVLWAMFGGISAPTTSNVLRQSTKIDTVHLLTDGYQGGGRWIFQLTDRLLQLQVNGEKPTIITSHDTGMLSNKWYQIAISRCGDRIAFYVDGVEISSDTWTGDLTTSSLWHTIGASGYSYSACVSSYFDDIRIYNRALTARELNTLYQSQIQAILPRKLNR